MKPDKFHIETRLVQDNLAAEKGAANKPIYQSTSFSYDTAEELEQIFNKKAKGFVYSRINNPTNNAFEVQMMKLDRGIGAVSFSSGMAAISTAVLALVEKGDEIIAGNSLFAGTYNFFASILDNFGIKTNFVEATDLEQYEKCLSERTKLIYLESMGNPGLDVPDIKKISKVAHQAGVPLIVDNTFMTPYLFQAKKFGADIVVYSTSKFINGSANSLGGVIVDLGTFNWNKEQFPVLEKYIKYGSFSYLARIRQDIFRNLGSCSSPFNSFLHSLGLGTLGLRMERHCENALQLARYLRTKALIKKVNYPGLPEHPSHEIASKQFADRFGGLLSFELEDKKTCFKLINNLQLARNMSNLGDIRTLVIHPASTIYSNIDEKQQKKLGVTPGLIRVSVGIENIEDIKNDFSQALNSIK